MFLTDGKMGGGMMALSRLGLNGVTCRRMRSRFGIVGELVSRVITAMIFLGP